MLLLKVSAVLLAVVCQMKSCSAAPARAAPDSLTDRVSLVDFEAGRLWSALLKSVEQMTEDLEPDSSVALRKRACNTATCVTHRLADFLSRAGGIGHTRFVATDVGSRAFGRRRRS